MSEIIKDILKKSYYESAYNCKACNYKVPVNTQREVAEKKKALEKLLKEKAKIPFRSESYHDILDSINVQELENLLSEDGRFIDLNENVEDSLKGIVRLANIAEKYHWHSGLPWKKDEKKCFLKAVIRYCKIEADREDLHESRFHSSIFKFPTAAINIFYSLLPEMINIEKNKGTGMGGDEIETYRQLLRVGLLPWTVPLRDDHTDKHPISVERFRNHVWWVSANALGYRPLLYSALMFRSVEMMDVLVYVATHAIYPVSSTNEKDAFWKEGICADGFGWGHGRQVYNTGYPADGMQGIFTIFQCAKNTPWEKALDSLDFRWMFNFIRGITWGAYKKYSAPMQGREIFKKRDISSIKYCKEEEYAMLLMKSLKDSVYDKLTADECREVDDYIKNGGADGLKGPEGYYDGIRFFWNNDTLIKKTKSYYFYVNMASSRRDGVEFADQMADKRNYFTADGSYVILKDGDEYSDAMGTWDVSRLPGVTERDLKNKEIKTETNWHGYRSKYNFAAGVFRGSNGVAGFIFEKNGKREADGAGIVYDDFTHKILGVRAYKAYFYIGDTVMCLGAGISDVYPDLGKAIQTQINNTKWKSNVNILSKEGKILEVIQEENTLMYNEKPLYLSHAGIIYGILPDGNSEIVISTKKKKTHWQDLNFLNDKVKDKVCPVFELSLNHGKKPVDESYAYYMYCGDLESCTYLKEKELVVLSNSKSIQSVANSNQSIVQAIFYNSEITLKTRMRDIRVSSTSAIMLETSENAYYITVCDATQNRDLKSITVSICEKGEVRWKEVCIQMPTKSLIGKPVSVKVNR